MAQIISQKDPVTGKRTQIGSVEGRTIEERQSNLVNAFGISKREANQLSGDDIAAKLTGPISTASLSAQPSFNIQTQPPSTAVNGLLGQFEASSDQFTKQLQQQADISQQREATAFESLFKELAGQATPAQLTADAYKKDVDPLTKEVTGLNNQLLAEQHALRRQKEAIEKNPEGMLRSQVNSELERAERESLRKQADIAVVLQAKQGMLTDAKATADRAVEAEVAFQQKKIDLLQLNYNRNKFLFDKDEQRNFENQQDLRQRALDAEENRLKEINNVALTYLQEGGDAGTAQRIMQSKSVAEAVGMTGGVIGRSARIQNAINQAKYTEIQNALLNPQVLDADTREKIGKSEITQKAVSQINLVQNLSELRSLIKEHGTKNIIDTEAAGKIAALRSQLEIDIAVAGGQGAISGEEAARYSNIVGSGWGDRQSKVLSQIDQAISTNNGKIKSNIGLLESTYKGAGKFEPFVEYISDVELQDFLDKELQVLTPEEQKASYIENWLLGK